jgi:hypothetical protein
MGSQFIQLPSILAGGLQANISNFLLPSSLEVTENYLKFSFLKPLETEAG